MAAIAVRAQRRDGSGPGRQSSWGRCYCVRACVQLDRGRPRTRLTPSSRALEAHKTLRWPPCAGTVRRVSRYRDFLSQRGVWGGSYAEGRSRALDLQRTHALPSLRLDDPDRGWKGDASSRRRGKEIDDDERKQAIGGRQSPAGTLHLFRSRDELWFDSWVEPRHHLAIELLARGRGLSHINGS